MSSGVLHPSTEAGSGPSSQPNALFRAYPELERALPVFPLTNLPTPVERLDALGSALGLENLWVKRDDMSGTVYGGNKPRKLEFLLGSARRAGVRRIVTFGALGTNHGLATCLACREAGIRITLILVDQPVTERVRLSLLRFAALGADLVYGGTLARTAAAATAVIVRCTVTDGRPPMIVPAGGSNPMGTVGQVAAAVELAEQVRAGLLPCPRAIFVAAGSGGTCAGLAAGVKLAGLPTEVVGVLVNDIMPPSSRSMARLANRTLALLRRASPRIPPIHVTPEEIRLVATEVGPGYGHPTAAGCAMIELAERLGSITLDPVYTAKAFAAVAKEAKVMRLAREPLLFWLTYCSSDPTQAIGPLPAAHELPAAFRRFFSD